jgi:hypothetical protein
MGYFHGNRHSGENVVRTWEFGWENLNVPMKMLPCTDESNSASSIYHFTKTSSYGFYKDSNSGPLLLLLIITDDNR